MHIADLADLLGARGPSIRWERLFLFTASLVVAELGVFAVGYSVSHSSDGGFSVGFFQSGSPLDVIRLLVASALRAIVALAAFRLIHRPNVALL